MPEIEIEIGGRSFQVACQEGEEHFLQSAAGLLDSEATALASAVGRLPETRMLLMAGLMLADKTAGLEEELRQARAEKPKTPAPSEKVQVSVIPQEITATLLSIAERTEGLAAKIDQKAAG